jgi:hypothetical protein
MSKLGVVAFSSTGDPAMGDYETNRQSFFGMASFHLPSTDILVAVVVSKQRSLDERTT